MYNVKRLSWAYKKSLLVTQRPLVLALKNVPITASETRMLKASFVKQAWLPP